MKKYFYIVMMLVQLIEATQYFYFWKIPAWYDMAFLYFFSTCLWFVFFIEERIREISN